LAGSVDAAVDAVARRRGADSDHSGRGNMWPSRRSAVSASRFGSRSLVQNPPSPAVDCISVDVAVAVKIGQRFADLGSTSALPWRVSARKQNRGSRGSTPIGDFRVQVDEPAPPRPGGLRRPPQRKRDLPARLQWMDGYEPGRAVAIRFSHFRALPNHPLFMRIHDRIVAGESVWPLARWVHASVPPDDPLGTATIDIDHLYRMLKRYKAMLPPHLFLPPQQGDRTRPRALAHVRPRPRRAPGDPRRRGRDHRRRRGRRR
jgi:hypothetical protein